VTREHGIVTRFWLVFWVVVSRNFMAQRKGIVARLTYII